MDPVMVGILGSCLLFLFLFIGVPIAFSLMLVGFLGTTYLTSIKRCTSDGCQDGL